MPEGPSIVILKELVQQFKGKKIIEVSGNSKMDISRLNNQAIIDFKSWGKHFLICFRNFTVRIHFMLFGSYRINEQKETKPRLSLQLENGELNFYTCSVQFIEEDLDKVYDWAGDVMNDDWDAGQAKTKLKQQLKTISTTGPSLIQHTYLFGNHSNINTNLKRIYHPYTTIILQH